MWRGVIEQYRPFLPVTDATPVITLGEGGTPLLECRAGREAGLRLLVKYEAANPTGSFKDRGMTVAVSKAVEAGARAVVCASTGNTAASAAAYAARAGLACVLLVPAGGVAAGKMAQAVVHGATIIPVRAGFDRVLELARQVAERFGLALVNSINPHRLAGQKTAAFEICDALGRAPQVLALPVGNAGNITAYWMGFVDYRAAGRIDRPPRMIGVQAEGAAPLVRGEPVDRPQTVASAIRIGRPASWQGAVRAVRESGGRFVAVSDERILAARDLLAREGLFVEPASAASVAGVLALAREGDLAGEVVCVLTGHGLKDPEAVPREDIPEPVPDTLEAIARRLP
ncbi:MAG: threonine synthase [Armatimonadota bacterium]|nr:threonine synthase [Armatimonadota bacterium]MDR7403463.1 threonine synthase [Armatimonadota bacterium]